MSTTTKQDKDFANELAGEARLEPSALQTAIDWIKDNLKPDDVFDEKQLLAFANQYAIYDVFPEKELIDWAESNGYVKE